MARGKYYTEEEDKRIRAVCDDNQELVNSKKYKVLAEKMQNYGICPNRDIDALSQHISKLSNSEPEDNEKDVKVEDVISDLLQIELNELNSKYEEIIHILIDECTEVKFGYLQFKYHLITNWLKKREGRRYMQRLADIEDIQQKNGER